MSDCSQWQVYLPDEAATASLGRFLGERMQAGQGLALVGELGSGKTCLARGVGHGLGLNDPDAVCSPTYLLVMEHPGPVPMIHLDAYLPAKTRGFLADGGLDYLNEAPGLVVVEWADRVSNLLPETTLWLRMGMQDTGRKVVISGPIASFRWLDTLPESFS